MKRAPGAVISSVTWRTPDLTAIRMAYSTRYEGKVMICRGVRGATTVASDTAEDILAGAGELLMAMIQANSIIVDDLASIWFTTTPDLVSVFPSRAARELGWDHVAMLNAQEIPVVGSLSRCIRVLMHWNTSKQAKEIVHVYLHDAVNLRPDVARTSSP